MKAIIKSVDFYVPEKRMSNNDFDAALETSDEWIYSHTGIKNRHIAKESQATSDLAYEASLKALARAKFHAKDLDLILVATVTGDYIGFPSTACILQDKLGATHAAAMDIQAGCTGFIYGLETARAFLESGAARSVLVVGADVLSRIADWSDRNTCVLFGDGAGAALLCAEDNAGDRGVLHSMLRADGSGGKWLDRPYGGTRCPKVPAEEASQGSYLRMDGRKVYSFAVKVISEGIVQLPEAKGFKTEDLAWIVPHQANARIIEAAAKRTKIPLEKFFMNIQEYANTSAASIPIALCEMEEKKLLKEGDLILTFGFGAGLTYGGNLIRW
jgi:3-oxoacyl-[acyl-carrier-protein] synthase-3